MKHLVFYTTFIVCIICQGNHFSFASSPESTVRVFGITEGSVYTGYVMPRWYGKEDFIATLQKDAGEPKSFSNGQKISKDGVYQLVIKQSFCGEISHTIINFKIDSHAKKAVIRTNSNNLNGREIMTGGSIIIPIDIKTLATIISSIKKGINNKNPI